MPKWDYNFYDRMKFKNKIQQNKPAQDEIKIDTTYRVYKEKKMAASIDVFIHKFIPNAS